MLNLALVALVFLGRAPARAEPPAQVMVLGTWHFDNPGLDVVNVKAEDVRTQKRQCELRAIAKSLAQFRPTKIMVESVANGPHLIDSGFRGFTPAQLLERKDERVQIGYRLAHLLRHDKVYAIDEQPSEGEPDYFPFGKVMQHAQANNQMARLQASMAQVEADKKAFEERQARTNLATLLIDTNEPSPWRAGISGYYEMLRVGDAQEQPGAELNAYWYMRNAKIFGKLMTLTQPGDRVLVLFGSSHSYWLRHFASEVIGFRDVDARPFLRRAAAVRC
ncbi:MAG TPA: DUF5694 domain-containing protein [Chloroflexota bacterium]|nr:DUF5694 domain-containing protein [Chloroflexota bacterium]